MDSDDFSTKKTTYRENVKINMKYAPYVIEFGASLVSKVERLCGRANALAVLDKIKHAKETSKSPLHRDAIEDIIQSHARSGLKEKIIRDWKAMYEAEHYAYQLLLEKYKKAQRTNSS